jgi:hypothetical protein
MFMKVPLIACASRLQYHSDPEVAAKCCHPEWPRNLAFDRRDIPAHAQHVRFQWEQGPCWSYYERVKWFPPVTAPAAGYISPASGDDLKRPSGGA